jgi:2-C-methyl-D-erythritol 4-phosphate cytidylyltransferase
MGRQGNKLFLLLGEIPIIARTLRVFETCGAITSVIVPAAREDKADLRRIADGCGLTKVVVTDGGADRQASVRGALRALTSADPAARRVVVHDGARPLLTASALSAFLAASRGLPAAVAALPVKDTIKEADGSDWVKSTLPRPALRAVQTPQVFERELLTAAHESAHEQGYRGTDDASLVEWHGGRVRLLAGWEENIKITTETDLLFAEILLKKREGAAREGRHGF